MSAIFLLIPLGLLMLALAIWAFIWAVQKRQFQDLDSAGHSILMEEKFAGSECSRQPQREVVQVSAKQKTAKPAKPDSKHHD